MQDGRTPHNPLAASMPVTATDQGLVAGCAGCHELVTPPAQFAFSIDAFELLYCATYSRSQVKSAL